MDNSDKGQQKSRWDWLPTAMPNVARLMAEKRKEFGDAHVNECWKRGVVQQEPGWLFAREGGVSIGMPWDAMADIALWQITRTQGLLVMRPPEAKP